MKEFIKNIILKIRMLFSRAEVHYINGNETLPPPLSAQEEEACIDALSNGDVDARQKLIEHNLRLVVYIARKFESTGIGIEDLISIGSIGLIKAVNTFNSSKNIKLATYASRCIENEILMYIRKNASRKLEISLDEPLNTDWDGNELLISDVLGTDDDVISRKLDDEVDKTVLMTAISKLSERERQIMEMRFGINSGQEMTQKDVADILGISQSYISRLEKKIIEHLKKEIIRLS